MEQEMEKLTYTSAKKELEAIVASIESGELDVDALTDKVKRASELITFCKDKLTKTDKELQKLLEELD
ncbi:MAG: exodeoxyribonuclease VII small subunit [Fermentimonas caenicola]|jgi:exodeoxyribonuclease VII small subunit|nr:MULTISPECIES: exodeoxyribonuclease VII small subunit [Lascolabacillus]MDI9626018.1 exodeoxyribonuclease VII small subunit [Bacteroidota bacterium]MCK9501508.1 exodeoxyribonuclease VII small subunit [Lascolabacillus sp.]MDD2607191.1 exodeoxyribonuclease VII small subunit [Lascolabacillus sp.]MDD3658365.1 exodeoxyribonuclease VII small subunit [Lascolabacillus sp.]MDD4757336.1 exodeoxyribonuclease VII small subunit [Lascolabacillus sp.]